MMSYWKRVDERLIKSGMLIMDLNFLRNYRDEPIRMNRKKRGRPYRIAESYVRFLAVIRHLFSLGYRQRDMVGGGWLRLQYPGSKRCSENISSPGSLDGWTQS
jgi:hypothetical protein